MIEYSFFKPSRFLTSGRDHFYDDRAHGSKLICQDWWLKDGKEAENCERKTQNYSISKTCMYICLNTTGLQPKINWVVSDPIIINVYNAEVPHLT